MPCAGVLGELRAEGCSVVVATHDLELAARIADRIVALEDGTVRDLGAPDGSTVRDIAVRDGDRSALSGRSGHARGDAAMRLTLLAASLIGALLFLWPFFGFGPAGDAPALTVALATAVGFGAIELGARRLDARGLALLAALSALAAGLRLVLVTGIGGFSPFFFLILVAGYAVGPSFGFLTGALALVVSAIVTGGVGPWLPYQLFAAGWVGLGAGLVGRGRLGFPTRRDIAVLAAYGVVAGFAFGAVMDLWDWSFFRGAPDLGWQPGLGRARDRRPVRQVLPRHVARVRRVPGDRQRRDGRRARGADARCARPAARPLAAGGRAAGTPAAGPRRARDRLALTAGTGRP